MSNQHTDDFDSDDLDGLDGIEDLELDSFEEETAEAATFDDDVIESSPADSVEEAEVDETEEEFVDFEDDVFDDEDEDEDVAGPAQGNNTKLIVAGALGVVLVCGAGYQMLVKKGAVGGAVAQTPSFAQTQVTSPNGFPAPAQASDQPSAFGQADQASELPSLAAGLSDSASSMSDMASSSFDKDELRTIIRDELSLQSKSDRSWMSQRFAEISISGDVGLSGSSPAVLASLQELGIKVDTLSSNVSEQISTNNSVIDLMGKEGALSDEEIKNLLGDRKRLKGFQVVNASKDNSMSILRTPSGRVQVFFAGERFFINGDAHKVASIHNQGRLILVADSGFIDGIYEKPAVKKSPKKAKPAPKKVKVAAPSPAPAAIEKPVPRVKANTLAGGQLPSYGWSFHGVFDDGYLLNNAKGEWVMVANGEFITGLGKVSGIDANRQLVVGPYIIPLAQ